MRSNANKNIIYSIILLFLIAIVWLYRQNKQEAPVSPDQQTVSGKVTLSGKTMGTTYRVVYLDAQQRDFQVSIDSLLEVFNQSLSTYIPNSEISRLNQGDSLRFELPYLLPVLLESRLVFDQTGGAFDPTVGPLVNLWGFGPDGPQLKDSVNIDAILKLVGFNGIQFDSNVVRKARREMYVDFSAIAKGYGVDVVGDFLAKKGITNFLVEIGGELVARGTNEKGELWKVGVNKPEELGRADELYSILALNNQGMATSGNYRNYYEVDGLKISHTINPATGRPVSHGLLSATVVAGSCMRADALATAMMVVGKNRAIALQEQLKDFEIFLIFSDSVGQMQFHASEGMKPYLSFPAN